MKILLILIISSTSLFAAKGHETGNGGDVIVCTEGNKTTYELLDYYEGRMNFRKEVDFSKGKTLEKKIENVLKKISVRNMSRLKRYMVLVKKFMQETNFVNYDLEDIPDHNEVYLEDHCEIKQLAIQYPNYENNTREYIVDKRIWDNLEVSDKAGLIIHEVIYNEMIGLGHKDSRFTRKLNYQIASDTIQRRSTFVEDINNMVFDSKNKTMDKCSNSRDIVKVLSSFNFAWAQKMCLDRFFYAYSGISSPGILRAEKFKAIWNSLLDETIESISMEHPWTLRKFYELGDKFFGREYSTLIDANKSDKFVNDFQDMYEKTDLKKAKVFIVAILSKIDAKELRPSFKTSVIKNLSSLQNALEDYCYSDKTSYKCLFEDLFTGPINMMLKINTTKSFRAIEVLLRTMNRKYMLGNAIYRYYSVNNLLNHKLNKVLIGYAKISDDSNMILNLLKRFPKGSRAALEKLFMDKLERILLIDSSRSKYFFSKKFIENPFINHFFGNENSFYTYNLNKLITEKSIKKLTDYKGKNLYMLTSTFLDFKYVLKENSPVWAKIIKSLSSEARNKKFLQRGFELLDRLNTITEESVYEILEGLFSDKMKESERASLMALELIYKAKTISDNSKRTLKQISKTDFRARVRQKASEILSKY